MKNVSRRGLLGGAAGAVGLAGVLLVVGDQTDTPPPTGAGTDAGVGASAENEIFINPATGHPLGGGTLTTSDLAGWPGVVLPPGADTLLSWIVRQPTGWSAMDVEVDWVPTARGISGAHVDFGFYSISKEQLVAGVDNMSAGNDQIMLTPGSSTNDTTNVPIRTMIASHQTFDGDVGKIIRVLLGRKGTVDDTFEHPILLLNVRITRNFS